MQVMQDLMCVFVYTYAKRFNPWQIPVEKQEFVDSTNGRSAAGLSRHTHTDRSMRVDVD